MRRRLSLVCALAAAVAALAPAGPAAADPVFPVCGEVNPAPQLFGDPTYTYLCLGGESGLYDPVWGPYCRAADPLYGCHFTVTAGYEGAADVDAQLCTAGAGQQPLCTSVDTGILPLLRIEPTHVCYGWSPWESPCYYREVDDQ